MAVYVCLCVNGSLFLRANHCHMAKTSLKSQLLMLKRLFSEGELRQQSVIEDPEPHGPRRRCSQRKFNDKLQAAVSVKPYEPQFDLQDKRSLNYWGVFFGLF